MSRGATREGLRTLRAGLRQLLAVRWVRALVVLLLLALVARLSLGLVLSTVVSRLAAQRELSVTWEDLDLSLSGGGGGVHWLSVASLTPEGEPGEPLLEVEYAVFDLDVLRLLRGELSVRRAEVDGADLYLERAADGGWNYERHLDVAEVLSLLEREPEQARAETEQSAAEPIELVPPVAIGALRLQQARLHLADRTLEPERRLTLDASAWLSSLDSAKGRPTRFGFEVFGADLLDTARVDGQARWSEDGLALELRAQAGAQRLDALADYLEPLRVRPVAATIEAAVQASIELSVVGELRDALAVRLELSDARILVDGADPFVLQRLALDVPSLSAEGARIEALEVSGARGALELRPDGALRLAGFDLVAPPREPRPPLAWEDIVASVLDLAAPGSLPPWIALLAHADDPAWPWSLERLAASDCVFQVQDSHVEPPTRFVLEVAEAEVDGLRHDPTVEPQPLTFAARMAAPGLVGSIEVSGSTLPWAPRRQLELNLALDGIAPAAADVYLERTGVQRTLESGRLELALSAEALEADGVTRGWVATREVALEDSGELFGVRELAVRDIVVDPAARKLRLGEMIVSGPRLAFVRDPAESFLALGLRVGAASLAAPVPAEPAGDGDQVAQDEPAAPSAAAVARAPREPVVLEIGRVAWLDSRVTFVDESTDPPTTFALDELGLELTDLVLGGDPAGPEPPPARLTGGLRAEGLAERIALEGRVRSRPGTLDLEAEVAVTGEGLRGALLTPYLQPFGITPLLERGRLTARATASLRATEQGWVAGVRAEQVALTEGDELLLGVDLLAVEDVSLDGDVLDFRHAELTGPFARIARDADGELVLGGVRVAVKPGEREDLEPIPWPELPPLRFDELDVRGARIALADATFEPPLELELELDAHVLDLARDGRRGTYAVDLAVPGVVEALGLRGTLTATPEALDLELAVEARGIRAGPLAPLLPRGVELAAEDGRLAAALSAALRRTGEHGGALRLEVTDVHWGEAGQVPWLALERLLLDAPLVDIETRELELTELRSEGLTVHARRDAEGVLHALGMRLAGSDAAPPPSTAAEPSRRLPARADATPPTVRLGGVRLGLDRFAFVDETLGPEALPVAGWVRFELEPGVVVRPEPADLPPLAWHVEGALEGLIERWRVDGTLAPFAAEPRLEATLAATGVRTKGLTELAPRLAERVTGEVEQGTASGRLEAVLSVRRSHPTDLALDQPFGGALHVSDLAYRDAPDGEVLLGLDGLDVEIRRIDPAGGGVHLDLVELRTPRARLWREGMVVHAAGLAVDLAPPPAEEAATGSTQEAAVEEASFAVAAPEPAAGQDPAEEGDARAPDLRVDRFVLSGLDVEIVDRTVAPPIVVPLTHLELETGRVSTRDLARGGAVSFSGELGAQPPDGGPPVFEEVSWAGRVAPLPQPKGWLQLYLSGLELVDFSGLAAEQGLTLDDGALDLSSRLRLKGERGASAGVTVVFTDLDVSEPEGGFLENLLSLPVTLDTALFLLRNADGEHRVSVDVDVGPDGVGAGAIAAAAAGAMVQVVAGAVAGAPLRLLGSVVPGGGEDEEEPRDVSAIAFAPGSSELADDERARLAELAWRARTRPSLRVAVRHELTAADLERAAVLANPTPAECLELTAGLRQRKSELWRRRDALSAQARALYAVGARDAGQVGDALRAVEVELAEVEGALDRVLDVLRSDSQRQRAKRTRAAARAIAELRLDMVADFLRQALADSRPERLEVRPARSTALDEPAGGRVVIELIER